jgi:uncharacterized membrane protein
MKDEKLYGVERSNASLIRSMGRFASAALVVAVLFAGPGQAQEFVDPDPLYEVVELNTGESLPLRQQPDPEGEIVGELHAEADDVLLSGAVIHAAGTEWYQVVHDDGKAAWAEARHLRARDNTGASDYAIQCTGTEPFWSLSIAGTTARFSTPDIADVAWAASEWLPARGLTGRFMVRLEADDPGYLAVFRARQYCTDGMSEINYPFEALLITPAQAVRAGCCRRGHPID